MISLFFHVESSEFFSFDHFFLASVGHGPTQSLPLWCYNRVTQRFEPFARSFAYVTLLINDKDAPVSSDIRAMTSPSWAQRHMSTCGEVPSASFTDFAESLISDLCSRGPGRCHFVSVPPSLHSGDLCPAFPHLKQIIGRFVCCRGGLGSFSFGLLPDSTS